MPPKKMKMSTPVENAAGEDSESSVEFVEPSDSSGGESEEESEGNAESDGDVQLIGQFNKPQKSTPVEKAAVKVEKDITYDLVPFEKGVKLKADPEGIEASTSSTSKPTTSAAPRGRGKRAQKVTVPSTDGIKKEIEIKEEEDIEGSSDIKAEIDIKEEPIIDSEEEEEDDGDGGDGGEGGDDSEDGGASAGGSAGDIASVDGGTTEPTMLKCEICLDKFISKSSIEKHVHAHAAGDKFKCLVCDFQTPKKSILRGHMVEHGRVRSSDSDYEIHSCSICLEEFGTITDYKEHNCNNRRREHKPKCFVCSKEFADKLNLDTHLNVHNGKELCCVICYDMFKNVSQFQGHVENHENDFPCVVS